MITVMLVNDAPSGVPNTTPATEAPENARLRKRLRACLPVVHATETEDASGQIPCGESCVKITSCASAHMPGRRLDLVNTNHSRSDTEDIPPLSTKPIQSLRKRRQHKSLPCSSPCSASSSSSTSSTFSMAKKGVTYSHDGALVRCRFCEILESGEEPFLYEDDDVVVFRPLAPVVVSHVLVVPRCHIRNVNKLTQDDAALLRHMREVAAMVLRNMPRPSVLLAPSKAERAHNVAEDCIDEEDFESDFKFAFHSPPFNSIDHVHMHAFRTRDGRFGCVGSIKYRTETWWCRSFDEVMTRLGLCNRDIPTVGSVTKNKKHRRKHHPSHLPYGGVNTSILLTSVQRLG